MKSAVLLFLTKRPDDSFSDGEAACWLFLALILDELEG
jgi:hypothetical protein